MRAVVVALLTVLVFTGSVELWMLFVLAFVFGAVDAFFWPAQGAMVPMLVVDDELPGANGLMQGSQQLTGLLGPALAGILVAAVGTAWAFGIDAVVVRGRRARPGIHHRRPTADGHRRAPAWPPAAPSGQAWPMPGAIPPSAR